MIHRDLKPANIKLKEDGFRQTDADERKATFSLHGQWVAHHSDESGQAEIYLRSFADPGPRWQVSIDGGADPLWNPRGGERFTATSTR